MSAIRRRAVRDGLIIASVYGTTIFSVVNIRHFGLDYDAHAYWIVWKHAAMYGESPHDKDAFLYSPAFAQTIRPLTALGWHPFAAAWTTVTAALFVWLLWPLRWPWRLLCLVLLLPEITAGNIWALLAVVLVVGLRHPSAWAFAALTKVTVAIGFIWFATRREWRKFMIAAATTLLIAAISAAVSPELWRQWFAFLANGGGHYAVHSMNVPPVIRFPLATAVTVEAARRDKPVWLVPAMILAAPLFYLNTLALLAAIPRLQSSSARQPEGTITTVSAASTPA